MTLFVNCCVRPQSRTLKIARALLDRLGGEIEEVTLADENLSPICEEKLNRRNNLIADAAWQDEMFRYARQFAAADRIVMAAPYWDLSFPALLKAYVESLCVTGITFRYSEQGIPVGLCKAKKLWYVTTAGGPYTPDFSYGYIEGLCKGFFGIRETELVKAEMLDVIGFDAEKIVEETIQSL